MQCLTGITDTDKLIVDLLDPSGYAHLTMLCRESRDFCTDQRWKYFVEVVFGMDIVNAKRKAITYREQYKSLSEFVDLKRAESSPTLLDMLRSEYIYQEHYMLTYRKYKRYSMRSNKECFEMINSYDRFLIYAQWYPFNDGCTLPTIIHRVIRLQDEEFFQRIKCCVNTKHLCITGSDNIDFLLRMGYELREILNDKSSTEMWMYASKLTKKDTIIDLAILWNRADVLQKFYL